MQVPLKSPLTSDANTVIVNPQWLQYFTTLQPGGANANYANFAGIANNANVATNSNYANVSGISTNANFSNVSTNSNFSNVSANSNFANVANSANDSNAIHKNVANEINGITLKGTPVANDVIVIEDSAANFAKKSILVSSLPSNGGGTYTFANSIANTTNTITLVNDVASPSANYYYGTNGAGTKGYYALPTSGNSSGIPIATATGANVITANYSSAPSIVDQLLLAFVATSNNTGAAPTFNPNSIQANIVYRNGGWPLMTNDITTNGCYFIEFCSNLNGWNLQNPNYPYCNTNSGSNYTIAIANTQETTTNTSPTMLKEFTATQSGNITVNWQMKSSNTIISAFGQVYVSNVAQGSNSSVVGTSYSTVSQIVTVAANNLFQIYIWTGLANTTAYCANANVTTGQMTVVTPAPTNAVVNIN
jgi:hypothetical protein